MRKSHCLLLVALLVIAAGGCRTRGHREVSKDGPGCNHVVEAGQSISGISQLYHVDINEIIKANDLQNIALIAGQVLFIPGGKALPIAPKPIEKPAAPAPAAAYAIPRANWSVESIDGGNIDPMGSSVWRITIHHSADAPDLTDDPVATLRRIERQHMMGMGKNEPFACIGYHFIISADGRVWEGRPVKFQGAHATGDNNKGNIGICLLGNFNKQHVTAAQRASLDRLVDRLCRDFHVSKSNIVGHNHFKSTDCPGKNLEPIVEAYAKGR